MSSVARRDTLAEINERVTSDDFVNKMTAATGDRALARSIARAGMTLLQVNPSLLQGDVSKASIFTSFIRCAQDKLIPDGREAAFVRFGKDLAYLPMIAGLRRKAAEAGITLSAQVVYANDEFDYELGLRPYLRHKPVKLGQPRGEPIGAYAVAHDGSGNPVGLPEIMDKAEIEAVRNVSKAKDSGPWNSAFAPEMWRKTVARRKFKSLPLILSEELHDAEEVAFGPLGSLPEVPTAPEEPVEVSPEA